MSLPPGDVRVAVPAPRRLPPPHLGHAYRNVFVETAALEVVITMPASGGDDAQVFAPAASAARAADADASVDPAPPAPPRTPPHRPRAPHRAAATGASLDHRGGTSASRDGSHAPPADGAPRQRPVTLSRRALAVLVVLAGLGALVLVVTGLAAVFGALLLTGTARL